MRDLDKTFKMPVATTIIVTAITLYKGNTIFESYTVRYIILSIFYL